MSDQKYWELRAEWLKLRGYLFDPGTGLPALPAVIEDVRRRLEDGEPIGLIYLDLSSGGGMEAICGWQTYDRLLQQLTATLFEFREGALTPRDAVALTAVRGDEFLLFVGPRPNQALDERRLTRLRERLVDDLEGRLRLELDSQVPQGIVVACGSAMVRTDPTVRIERSIYQSIDEVRSICRRQRERRRGMHLNELRRILASRDVLIRYQPIVRLEDGLIHGFEALSSGPSGDIFHNPEMLFSFAEETEQIVELERLCRQQAIRGAALLHPQQKLFINCSAHGFVDPELVSPAILDEVRAAGRDPRDIVFEVTERVAITEWQEFRAIVAKLRGLGFSIAIDDMGAGYSSLQAVAEVEPDYLKFDISLVRDVHLSPIKRNLLETLVVLADKIRARAIAEGVESVEEFKTLRAMGVTFAQGFYFAMPEILAGPAPLRLRERFEAAAAGEAARPAGAPAGAEPADPADPVGGVAGAAGSAGPEVPS
ncbi:MAG TPA: EAL domain-containing protein [Thermoanaerobaculia bacterium]|nr:EAL domain-containing protein [Thermoanaerobaculia bacterium]